MPTLRALFLLLLHSAIMVRTSSFMIRSAGKVCQDWASQGIIKSFNHHHHHHHQVPSTRLLASVSGTAYAANDPDAPNVQLFTKEGCTLCDKVKDVLRTVRDEYPHTLEQIDITDDENAGWYSKYKYDIPVLHMNTQYWIKHCISAEEATSGFQEARDGQFAKRTGEPDAEAMETKR